MIYITNTNVRIKKTTRDLICKSVNNGLMIRIDRAIDTYETYTQEDIDELHGYLDDLIENPYD